MKPIIRHRQWANTVQEALERDADRDKPRGRYALPARLFGQSPTAPPTPVPTTTDGRTVVPSCTSPVDPVTEFAGPSPTATRFSMVPNPSDPANDVINWAAFAPDSLNDPMDPNDPGGLTG
ncbi:hypothetical protein MAUB_47910 [Mycolicibacterium aubagnense]|uniref:Uncharacterized protein n=1 Tax=Mycolicibacterium aubagnense TaxID=319707 RepID=A0ABM7IJN1_9MYCO|nr:hypothetical protein MAUB_47910 [Mycolicibacterium aubagnense]